MTTTTDSPVAAPGRFARLGPQQRIALLVAIVGAFAVALFVVVVRHLPGAGEHAPLTWPLWVAAFAVAELLVVHVQFEREAHSFSLTDAVLVLGLFLMTPAELVVTQVAGAGLTLVIHRRQSMLKLSFNLVQYAIGGTLATMVFAAVAGTPAGNGPLSWTAALLAVLVTTLTADLCIFAAISLSEGHTELRRLPAMMKLSLPFSLAVAGVGLVAALTAVYQPWALVLLALPALMTLAAYRAYTHSREQQDNLRLLHEVTSMLHHGGDADAAVTDFLDSVRAAFRAGVAELILFGAADQGAPTVSSSQAGQETVVMAPLHDLPAHQRLLRHLQTAPGALTRAGARQPGLLHDYAVGRGLRDVMVSVLRTDDRVHGLLLVADRFGDVSTFTGSDLALLENFAQHVATSLERGRLETTLRQVTDLKEQLRHEALHDPLTGLPNRTLFLDRARHSVGAATRTGAWPAVLYLDLDDFKPVNDNYGHDAGDALLRAVATRLTGCLRPGDTAARLGGDEFAVLLEGPTDDAAVGQIVDRIRGQLAVPADLGHGRTVKLVASIGVAMGCTGLADADTLIRQADTAMYSAKRDGGGRHEVYQPRLGAADVTPHDPAAELAAAVRDGQLRVLYQPLIGLGSGRPVGAEALVRWDHPTDGLRTPD